MRYPFKRRKRIRIEQAGEALVTAAEAYARHELTWEELADRYASVLAEIRIQGQLGRLSEAHIDRIMDSLDQLDPDTRHFLFIHLHTAFAGIDLHPIGAYGRRIVASEGLRILRECAESATKAGRLEEAASLVDSPHSYSWLADTPTPDGYWFLTKARVLRAVNRDNDALAAARQGEQLIEAYLGGEQAAQLPEDARETLTEAARALRALADTIGA